MILCKSNHDFYSKKKKIHDFVVFSKKKNIPSTIKRWKIKKYHYVLDVELMA